MRKFNKVFGIGLSRTGTVSLTEALNILDIPTRHYPDSKKAFKRLYNGLFDIPELEKYEGITDIMAAAFYEGFDRTYPGSLFILTTRNPRVEWLESCRKKMKGVPLKERKKQKLKPYRSELDLAVFLRIATYGTGVWDKARFKFTYKTHWNNVHTYFLSKMDQLLVLDICGGEGWEPLCNFLETPIPDVPFPHLHQAGSNQKRQAKEDAREFADEEE